MLVRQANYGFKFFFVHVVFGQLMSVCLCFTKNILSLASVAVKCYGESAYSSAICI